MENKSGIPIDFSVGSWILRNGNYVTGLKKETIGDINEDLWNWLKPESNYIWLYEPTNSYWDADGIHLGNLDVDHDQLMDIIRPVKTPVLRHSRLVPLPEVERKKIVEGKWTDPRVYVITGGSSGLGRAIIEQIRKNEPKVCEIYNLDLKYKNQNALPSDQTDIYCDIASPGSIDGTLPFLPSKIDVLVNCAGINAIEWFEKLDVETWDKVMNINARGIFLISQALLPALKETKGTILNIISNASHMPMTNSAAYNASKGAAHILTLQMARELTKLHGVTVFGLSPNKMAGTEMSRYIEGRVPELRGWSEEQAATYQKQALLTGEETDVNTVGEFVAWLLADKKRHKFLAGCVIPYGA